MARWGDLNPETKLCSGMLTLENCAALGVSRNELDRICEGFGTFVCSNCPFAKYIPEECEGDGDPNTCIACKLVCPCNRTYRYDEVRRVVLRYEISRGQ